MKRRGVAVVLALSIVLVLGCFGTVLFRYSRGATREVDALSGHLRALAVADAAYAEMVSRLSETGWEGRWFRGSPDARRDVSAVGGTYDAVIRDAPGNQDLPTLPVLMSVLPPGQAELLVKAHWKAHSVVCVWRLIVPRDGFDELARILPTYFGHVPESTEATPAAMDPLSAMIDEQVKRRERNRVRFEGQRPGLDAAGTPRELAAAMGMPAPSGAVEELPSGNGGPGLPLGQYVDSVRSGLPRDPEIPGDGPWADAPWRQWRLSGPDGVGSRTGISDRSARGTDAEAARWAAWPGWQVPGGGSPWAFAPGWDGWRHWGENQTDQAGGWTAGGYGQGGSRNWWQWLQAAATLMGMGGRRSGF